MTKFELATRFFLATAVILGSCRVVGLLTSRLRQPPVIAEMIAGILLGPTLLGLFWGGAAMNWLFHDDVKLVLHTFAQVGLALYMFLVGIEFRTELVVRGLRSAAAISAAGILVPLGLGALIATAAWDNPVYFPADVRAVDAALFMGAALSITAFPVLARIVSESGLGGTKIGTLTLGAGFINDGLAWCVLAVVLGSIGGDGGLAIKAFGGGIAYCILVLTLGRVGLARLARSMPATTSGEWPVRPGHFTIVLILLGLGAWFTDVIGVHAVFGAFVLGLAVPRGPFAAGLKRMIAPLTTGLLVPMYFVSSGLNTQVGLLDSWPLWAMAAVVFAAACVGKFAACAGAARLTGETWRDSFGIGALMNCRGLMELLILNIGLERGIITPTMFSIGVLMALGTTLMATPMFRLAYRGAAGEQPSSAPEAAPASDRPRPLHDALTGHADDRA
ncbi:MAG TPA: cation:proton antiporter [Phycisphaerales bacterium]|nr:cation:proton antiporter [Phycisphaerales bacterium]